MTKALIGPIRIGHLFRKNITIATDTPVHQHRSKTNSGKMGTAQPIQMDGEKSKGHGTFRRNLLAVHGIYKSKTCLTNTGHLFYQGWHSGIV